MHTCIHAYTLLYISIFASNRVHVCILLSICMYANTHTHAYMHAYVHACMHACVFADVSFCMCAYTHIKLLAMYLCIHVLRIHAYIHPCIRILIFSCYLHKFLQDLWCDVWWVRSCLYVMRALIFFVCTMHIGEGAGEPGLWTRGHTAGAKAESE